MTYDSVMSLVSALGSDVTVQILDDDSLEVTVEDLAGLDSYGCVVYRNCAWRAVRAVLGVLLDACESVKFYAMRLHLQFPDFRLVWKYASFEAQRSYFLARA